MIDRRESSRKTSRGRFRAVLVLLACLLPVLPVAAQERGGDDEVRAAREQIRVLLREAKELDERGWETKAREAREKAEQIEARLVRHERERARGDGELRGILEGLEHGMVALEKLGRREALQMLRRIADEVRAEMRGHERPRRGMNERQVAERQIEVLRLAQKALAEEEREDAVEALQRAIRAREVGLEGRRDEEAQMIRRRQPGREDIIELLGMAEAIYREYDMPDRADMVGRGADELWSKPDRSRRQPRAQREQPRREAAGREAMRRDVEIMRMAMPALRESGRVDIAELMEHAIQARIVELEDMKGEEAEMVRRRAPELGQVVEMLTYAGKLWREYGDAEKAEVITEHARKMWAGRDRDRPQPERRRVQRDAPRRDEANRIERLQDRLGELEHAIRELWQEIETLKRERH